MFNSLKKILSKKGKRCYRGLSHITSLDECPRGVEKLILKDCTHLTSLDGCPPNVKILILFGCLSLESLHGCPDGLEILDLRECYSLRSFEGCPNSVKDISLSYIATKNIYENNENILECTTMRSMNGFPDGDVEVSLHAHRSFIINGDKYMGLRGINVTTPMLSRRKRNGHIFLRV